MENISLNGAWIGKCIPPQAEAFDFSASVPGSAINDLINAGRLPRDIFRGKNADAVSQFEDCAFEYTRTFSCAPVGRIASLVFEQLDTYCDVWLNGKHLGFRENGNIAHAFDVTDVLQDGENTLTVRFYSPLLRVQGKPARSAAFTCERLHTRRMQCTYGWDWVARFLTCGLPGNVTLCLREKSEIELDGAYIYTRIIDDDGAQVGADVTFKSIAPGRVLDFEIVSPTGKIAAAQRRFCGENFLRMTFDIPDPALWYPAGYGAQPLYTFMVKDAGRIVHSEKFGIRTVRILQLTDAPDTPEYEKCLSIKNPDYDFNDVFSGFILKVNGVRIMCKGANWVPCEPFCTGDTSEKVTRTLTLARDAGLNMVRIWGGGRFETPHFYDECSRLGIMVTQDFLMACGSYPEEEDWFIGQLQQEAEYAARLMRNKACLMWWSGDNENAVNGCDTDENYMGRRSAYGGIFPVLSRLDPRRDFLPSSPFGGRKYASNTVGTTHNTQFLGEFLPWIMGEGDLSDYKEKLMDYRARFIAEEPQLGAAAYETLSKFMTDEEIFGESYDMWIFHTKTNPALPYQLFDYMETFARKLMGDFTDGRDRLFKLQYIQYEWLRISMEQARREKWFCSGVIYWMLNDCWPAAAGWSLIDFCNRPKAAWYSFKRAATPLMTSIEECEDRLLVYAVNDSPAPMTVNGVIRAVKGDKIREIGVFSAEVPAGTSVVAVCVENSLAPGEVMMSDVTDGVNSHRSFWKSGGLRLVPAGVRCVRSENSVTVTADAYVHAVELPAAIAPEDNFFSLLPGETRMIPCKNPVPAEIQASAYTLA